MTSRAESFTNLTVQFLFPYILYALLGTRISICSRKCSTETCRRWPSSRYYYYIVLDFINFYIFRFVYLSCSFIFASSSYYLIQLFCLKSGHYKTRLYLTPLPTIKLEQCMDDRQISLITAIGLNYHLL